MPFEQIMNEIIKNSPFLIPIAIIVTIFIIIIFTVIMMEKKRTQAVKNLAMGSGLSWIGDADERFIERLSGFKLLSKGHSKKAYNVVSGRYANRRWKYFDYKYTVGGGKSSSTYNLTVAAVEMEQDMPSFALRNENIFHKLGDILGFKDIDFESHPSFSDNYLLKGDDEEALRELFATHILSYFESKEIRYNIEAYADKMIIYLEKRVSVSDYRKFIDDTSNIAKLFLRM